MKQEFFSRKRIAELFFTLIATFLIPGIKELLPVFGVTSTTVISIVHYASIITLCLGLLLFIFLFIKWNIHDLLMNIDNKISGLEQKMLEIKNSRVLDIVDSKILSEKQDLLNRIDRLRNELSTKTDNNEDLRNKEFEKINVSINELQNELSTLKPFINNTVDEKLKTLGKKLKNKFLEIEAEIYRTLALALYSQKNYSHSILYASETLRRLVEIKYEKDIKKFVDFINTIIIDMKDNKQNNVHGLEKVKSNVKLLPEILIKEKKEILTFLETCVNVE